MYGVLALLVCVVVVGSADTGCCVPPQWTGVMSTITSVVRDGKIVVNRGSMSMAYDGVNQIIGIREDIELGKKGIHVDMLLDYKSQSRYVLSNGKCVKTSLGKWNDGCIPANATKMASDSVLGLGTNALDIDSYSIEFGPVTAYLGMTSSGCIPVMETFRGLLDNTYFLQNNHYINISAGIPDDVKTAISSPPAECASAPTVTSHFSVTGMMGVGPVGKRSAFMGF